MNPNNAGKQSNQLLNRPRAPPSIPPPSCPRCASDRTKFCYYNNYSVSQPRYFCKECRRYWTHGGTLRSIPSGGTSRGKRARTDVATSSSSSQILHSPSPRNLLSSPPPPPPPLTWTLGSYPDNPNSGTTVASSTIIGRGTFKPLITETMQYLNGGGGFFNQTPFKFNQGGMNMAFGGGAPPPLPPPPSPPAPPAVQSTQFSPFDNLHDFGFPFLQRPLQHPPASSVLGSQNMGINYNSRTTLTGSNYFSSIGRDPTAHVVSIDEWSELNDMDNEADPFQCYKPPSP